MPLSINKNKLLDFTVIGIITFLVLFIFPLNIIYLYLLRKAYNKDCDNILSSLLHIFKEYFDWISNIVINGYQKYKQNHKLTDRIGRWKETYSVSHQK